MEKRNDTARWCGKKDRGVSEIIGSILLVSIVITAASIVGVLLWSQPTMGKIPSLDAVISLDTGNKMVHLYHNGGETLTSGDFIIHVNGFNVTSNFTKSRASGWSNWATGESLDYNYTGNDQPQTVQIILTSGGYSTIIADARLT